MVGAWKAVQKDAGSILYRILLFLLYSKSEGCWFGSRHSKAIKFRLQKYEIFPPLFSSKGLRTCMPHHGKSHYKVLYSEKSTRLCRSVYSYFMVAMSVLAMMNLEWDPNVKIRNSCLKGQFLRQLKSYKIIFYSKFVYFILLRGCAYFTSLLATILPLRVYCISCY